MEIDKKEEIYEKTYIKVLNFLSYRKRSTKEIFDRVDRYLRKIGLSLRENNGIKDKIISTLESDGYLKSSYSNDIEFAEYYISSLEKSGKTLNKIKIYRFLNDRGVPKNIIEEALNKVDSESVYQSALSDAEKKLKILKGKDKYVKKKKLLDYLYRKGYPYETSSSVVDTLL
jgi:regulatory protein